MRIFKDWLASMRASINNYDYYVDFDKVYENTESIKIELNIMNSLIGSKNIEADFLLSIEAVSRNTEMYSNFISCKAERNICSRFRGSCAIQFC